MQHSVEIEKNLDLNFLRYDQQVQFIIFPWKEGKKIYLSDTEK